MSKWIECERCGQMKEVPAYPGDGVYHQHVCVDPRHAERMAWARLEAVDLMEGRE